MHVIFRKNKMKLGLIISPLAISVLASCGGGGAETLESFNPATSDGLPSVIKKFSDGSGIVTLTDTVNGIRIQSTALVGDVNINNTSESLAVNYSGQQLQKQTASGAFYTAKMTVNNVQTDVILYLANDGTTAFGLADNCIGPCVVSGGIAPASLPQGTFIYTGDFAGIATGTANLPSDISLATTGTFTMNANFTSGKASMAATLSTTEDGGASLTANNMQIDSNTGQFNGSGSLVSLSRLGGTGSEWDADIYGSFNGLNAESVSGVFTTTSNTIDGGDGEYTGAVSGGFAGTR